MLSRSGRDPGKSSSRPAPFPGPQRGRPWTTCASEDTGRMVTVCGNQRFGDRVTNSGATSLQRGPQQSNHSGRTFPAGSCKTHGLAQSVNSAQTAQPHAFSSSLPLHNSLLAMPNNDSIDRWPTNQHPTYHQYPPKASRVFDQVTLPHESSRGWPTADSTTHAQATATSHRRQNSSQGWLSMDIRPPPPTYEMHQLRNRTNYKGAFIPIGNARNYEQERTETDVPQQSLRHWDSHSHSPELPAYFQPPDYPRSATMQSVRPIAPEFQTRAENPHLRTMSSEYIPFSNSRVHIMPLAPGRHKVESAKLRNNQDKSPQQAAIAPSVPSMQLAGTVFCLVSVPNQIGNTNNGVAEHMEEKDTDRTTATNSYCEPNHRHTNSASELEVQALTGPLMEEEAAARRARERSKSDAGCRSSARPSSESREEGDVQQKPVRFRDSLVLSEGISVPTFSIPRRGDHVHSWCPDRVTLTSVSSSNNATSIIEDKICQQGQVQSIISQESRSPPLGDVGFGQFLLRPVARRSGDVVSQLESLNRTLQNEMSNQGPDKPLTRRPQDLYQRFHALQPQSQASRRTNSGSLRRRASEPELSDGGEAVGFVPRVHNIAQQQESPTSAFRKDLISVTSVNAADVQTRSAGLTEKDKKNDRKKDHEEKEERETDRRISPVRLVAPSKRRLLSQRATASAKVAPTPRRQRGRSEPDLAAMREATMARSTGYKDFRNLYEVKRAPGIPEHESLAERAARILGIAISEDALLGRNIVPGNPKMWMNNTNCPMELRDEVMIPPEGNYNHQDLYPNKNTIGKALAVPCSRSQTNGYQKIEAASQPATCVDHMVLEAESKVCERKYKPVVPPRRCSRTRLNVHNQIPMPRQSKKVDAAMATTVSGTTGKSGSEHRDLHRRRVGRVSLTGGNDADLVEMV
uniref:junctional cadherin 5-associated protein isoform X2 n=1 Tax=Myxine glutinosa TaxID=7769 RepID=UPI00358E8078